MRSRNTFGVQFIIRMNKMNGDHAPIYARITVDARRIEISLKRGINPIDWNSKKGTARGMSEEIKSLNHFLFQVKSRLIECYQELQIQKQLITAAAIKDKFLGADQKEHTIGTLIEYHNTKMKDSLAWGTLKNYFTTKKYIERFLRSKYKTNDVFLSQLNFAFITEFEYFLRNYKPQDHNRPLANNGVMKHIERFRKMTNMALRMEWIEKDPFAKYKQKFEKVERGFLTKEELTSIEYKDLHLERLQWVRDLFIFSCYTGVAYIDLMQLKPSNISRGIDGEFWMITNRQKTSNAVRVPLLPKALEIIDKYRDHPRSLSKDTLFPVISNQKLNSYLKEISELCGISKDLTFHLARHTFATTVTLTNGVPIESVSKMLGHTKITTTQIYAKVIEQKLGEDMRILKDKLFRKDNH